MKSPSETAKTVHSHFQEYLEEFQHLGEGAVHRFLNRDWQGRKTDAAKRLSLYENRVHRIVSEMTGNGAPDIQDRENWIRAKSIYERISREGDEPEIARTFFNSVSRRLYAIDGVDTTIEFTFQDKFGDDAPKMTPDLVRFPYRVPDAGTVLAQVIQRLGLPLEAFADLSRDVHWAVRRISDRLADTRMRQDRVTLRCMQPVLCRGNGAFIVGALSDGHTEVPLVLALLHPDEGVTIDAVIMDEIGLSILFSFTRSHFLGKLIHTPSAVGFLHALMPDKREAEIYVSLGHHKHGKTLLYRDLMAHQTCTSDLFELSPGIPGMVMVAFNMALDDMVFKVIRDSFENPKRTTTAQIKEKYDLVFRHDRVGRLVEAQEFEALEFDRCCFGEGLLEILRRDASGTVEMSGDRVLLRHVYVQRRVTPLDIYLREEAVPAAASAVRDLGRAIKDLMATNIFPGDILLKNFGVTRHKRVVFYDYDEICHVTDCRFRQTPPPRDDTDLFQDEPWFFVEENDVFPEEFIRFMGLSEDLRKEFVAHHRDLLGPDLWRQMHRDLGRGKTFYVRPYAEAYRLA